MNLRELGEFDLIERYAKPLEGPIGGLLVGIGDDCAVIRPPAGKNLLVTSDMMIEGTHFIRDRTDPQDLGHKALCASLSDVAAMGGRAIFAFLSLGIPSDTDLTWIGRFFDGLGQLARSFGVVLAGGDTVASDLITADVTVVGQGDPGHLTLRSGAKANELVLVTNHLGSSAAGLRLVTRSLDPDALPGGLRQIGHSSIAAHLRPWPRLREAAALVQSSPPSSMMDISDGLVGDARHIAAKSGVGLELWLGSVPIVEGLRELGAFLDESADDWALHGGEDYELLLTMPESAVEESVRRVRDATGTGMSVVGRVTSGSGVVLLDRSGRQIAAKNGFEHFRPFHCQGEAAYPAKGSKP